MHYLYTVYNCKFSDSFVVEEKPYLNHVCFLKTSELLDTFEYYLMYFAFIISELQDN